MEGDDRKAAEILYNEMHGENNSLIRNIKMDSYVGYGQHYDADFIVTIEVHSDGLMSLINLGNKEKEMERVDSIVRNYEFTVKDVSMVDVIEIAKYVNRDNPLSIVFSKDLDFNITIVHRNIIKKSRVVGLHDYFVDKNEKSYGDVFFYKTPKKDNEFIIKLVKMIKRAEWPTDFKSSKMRVIFPKI